MTIHVGRLACGLPTEVVRVSKPSPLKGKKTVLVLSATGPTGRRIIEGTLEFSQHVSISMLMCCYLLTSLPECRRRTSSPKPKEIILRTSGMEICAGDFTAKHAEDVKGMTPSRFS